MLSLPTLIECDRCQRMLPGAWLPACPHCGSLYAWELSNSLPQSIALPLQSDPLTELYLKELDWRM